MRKGKEVIGKPIVTLEGGERLATVHDLIFDQDANQLLAFLVDEGGWFHGAKVLPFANISSIGESAVVINGRDDIVAASSVPAVDAILKRNNILKGTTLMTTDGKNLGKLADLYFEEGTGRVIGYDVTGGLFADLATGRSFVPAPKTFTIGEDVAFVPPETAIDMEEQEPGGIKGALSSAKDSVAGAAAGVRDATRERQKEFAIGKTASRDVVADDGTLIVAKDAVITPADADRAEAHGAVGALFAAAGGGVLGEAVSSVKERVTGATGDVRDRALEDTIGRRVGSDVRADGGLLVAAQGQIVTQEVVDRARRYDREAQLIAAVSQERARRTADVAGDRLAAGATTVREGASNIIERAKESLTDARERAASASEERRINAAVGRPVTRVILDRQDSVILNVGELITFQSVEEARAAGVLDILLDSAYTETPKLDVDDLRAPEPGRASLEVEHGLAQPHETGSGAASPSMPAPTRTAPVQPGADLDGGVGSADRGATGSLDRGATGAVDRSRPGGAADEPSAPTSNLPVTDPNRDPDRR